MVDILSIKIGTQGVVTTLPGVGPLQDRMEIRTKVLAVQEGKAQFNDMSLTLRPMVGVIGVAPSDGAVPCGFPGNHGGNMDCKLMQEGARLYLPIRVKGGLFQLGDIHAIMGDGELCGTGLEIAGEVTVRFSLIKNHPLNWPVLETESHWHAIASDLDYTKALTAASQQMQELLSAAYGWDATDVYFYLSLEGDVSMNQGCQPCPVPMVLRLSVPKRADKPLLAATI